MAATYSAEQVAGLLGVSKGTLYHAVRTGDAPLPPIRVGKRLVWSRAAVDRLLGLETDAGTISSTRSETIGGDP